MKTICLDQLNRYHYNATVLGIQTDFRNWRYQKIGVTLCSDSINEMYAKKVVIEYVLYKRNYNENGKVGS